MINSNTLYKLVQILDRNNIICGVGGSYLLQLYDLYDEPDDVDFWISPNDVSKVKEIFSEYEEIQEKIQLPEEYHFKIMFYDIKVDFVACFIVKPNKNQYWYNISPDNVKMVDIKDGQRLPCTSLEDWYIVYKLLRREDKANIIEKHIKPGFDNSVLEKILDNKGNKLPLKVTKSINEAMWRNSQIQLKLNA